MTTLQEYLDNNWCPTQREKEEVLSINHLYYCGFSNHDLIPDQYHYLWTEGGTLNLSKYISLKEFLIDGSLKWESFEERMAPIKTPLTKLILNDCANLRVLEVYNHKLTNLNFLNDIPNPEKLTELNISGNSFSESDLKPFSKFINLERLIISNNKFKGSLEPLKNLTKIAEFSKFRVNF